MMPKITHREFTPPLLLAGLLLACGPAHAQPATATPTAAVAPAGVGNVEGSVQNTATGEYLFRARVTVAGTSLETFTDSDGRFVLGNVPAGPVTLQVFYTGLAPQSVTVDLAPGATVSHDFDLTPGPAEEKNVVKLSKYVVSTSKQMDAAAIAINEQRFAPNIVNVVSADEFGDVLENNVGDFLKRLPGITITYIGGAAQSISIGGVPPDYVPIRVNGFDVASVAGGGTGRGVDFHDISMNNIARLEVEHSPTPESPGSALAGSVNLIPRSAFDRSRPLFTYDVFLMMRDDDRHLFSKTPGPRWVNTRKVHPGFDFSYIRPVNKNFGFTLTGSTTTEYTEEELSRNAWRGAGAATTGGYLPDTTPDKPYLSDYTVEDGGKTVTRTSMATTVDYRFSPADRLSFSFEESLYDSPLNQRTLWFSVGRVDPGAFTVTSTHGHPGTGSVTNSSQSRQHRRQKIMPTLIYRHRGPIWQAEAGLGYSSEVLSFRSIDKGYFNNITSKLGGVTVNFDDIFYLQPAKITVTDASGAPVNPYVLDKYSIVSANGTANYTTDVKRSAYGNLRREFDVAGVPVALKGGLDVRDARRDNRGVTPTWKYVGPNPNASAIYDDVFSQRVAPYGFPKIQYMSTQQGYNYYQAHPDYFSLDQNNMYRSSVTDSKVAEETIYSGYIRGDLSLFHQRLKLVGGVRAEQTDVSAEGPLSDPTRNFQRDASGNVVHDAKGKPVPIATDPLAASQLTYLDRGSHVTKEYLRWFPSINASFDVTQNLIARAAYYTSIGRPNYNQYCGGITLPDLDNPPGPGNEIHLNNSAIKPWKAHTLNLRLEYYFKGVGQVAVGAFRRDFSNFFGSTIVDPTPDFLALYGLDPATYGQYQVSTQHNIAGTVRMTGVTFDYKQALTFLPHWARGVQVYANATALRATGDQTANFANFVPRSFNWGVSLTRPRYSVRVNWNYRGRARGGLVQGRGIEPGTYNWTSKLMVLDVQANYWLTPHLAVFANLRNLDDAPNDTKIYGPDTPLVARFRQRTYYGSLWSFGIKGRF